MSAPTRYRSLCSQILGAPFAPRKYAKGTRSAGRLAFIFYKQAAPWIPRSLLGYRYWDVNERSACWRSESVGLFIEPRAATRLARRAAAQESRSGAETPTRACVFLRGWGVGRVLKKGRVLPKSVLAYPKIEMETTSSMPTTQLAQGQCHLGRAERRQECALSNASQSQSRSKVLKRQRSNSPELLRCKRRLSFTGLGYSIPQQQPVAVARRNERERNRVKQVNMGFQTLRQHVPNGAANKKMSKVETLRSAVEYIRALQQLLDEHDAISAAFQCGVPSPTLSNSYSADPESPHSSYSSDDGTYEHLSSEEQELLDFTTWFNRY
ncbi:hypothetical protein KOW79_012391 [Hemibagrus wyckioides]|uniref:BHLH domain-containing protein n=2 Tax=Hemibagrus wyckioides TaxID=337641 RepID=A0A9D3NNT8_9TELE|nr:hypothetical protein KOW79_012391 [Hemibagrus wyckioides]